MIVLNRKSLCIYKINKFVHGKCFCMVFTHLLICFRKTHSLVRAKTCNFGMVRRENLSSSPPVANISWKIFLGALFNTLKCPYNPVPPPPPIFWCFLRPCLQQPLACIFQTLMLHEVLVFDQLTLNADSRLRQCCHGNTINLLYNMPQIVERLLLLTI